MSKITIHLPHRRKGYDLQKELNSARNIKDKKNRDSVVTGLNKIAQYL